jgi:hypothetical protein
MLSDIEHRIATLAAKIQFSANKPNRVPETNKHHHIHNWHCETINRTRFARLIITYSYEKPNGFTVKDLVHDLRISDVAVREMINYSITQDWLAKNDATNTYKVTEYSLEHNFNYVRSHMAHSQKWIAELNALLTVYNHSDNGETSYFSPTKFTEKK